MKPWFVITALTLGLVGCGHKNGNGPAAETESGVTFNPSHGLSIPAATARYVDLQVVEVEERKVASTLKFSAQLYRARETTTAGGATSGTALASGLVNTADAALLHEKQALTVTAGTGISLPGRIAALNRALEPANGEVEVLIAISDPQSQLVNGAFLTATAVIGGEKNVVGVPCPAVLRTAEGDFVYTANGDYFVRAQVKVGNSNSEFAEITDGLYAGDRVVVKPVLGLWMAELQSIRGGKACADGH